MSRYSFKVGDRVRVIRGEDAGAVCTVTSELHRVGEYEYDNCVPPDTLVHDIDLPPDPGWDCSYELPGNMVPYRDGDDKGEWTEELRRICRVDQKKAVPA